MSVGPSAHIGAGPAFSCRSGGGWDPGDREICLSPRLSLDPPMSRGRAAELIVPWRRFAHGMLPLMGFWGNRTTRRLVKRFRAEFDDAFAIYQAAVEQNRPYAPWPPRISYVAGVFDRARRTTTKGLPPLPEELELAFLDGAIAHAVLRAHVDPDLLLTAARIELAKRSPRDDQRRSLDDAMASLDDEQARRTRTI